MKRIDKRNIPTIMLTFIFAILLLFSIRGITTFWIHSNPERTEIVLQAIQKAAIQCYALEGSYPPDIDYLVEHYGLQLNDKEYVYRYEIFASNIMPEIEVHER